MKDTFKRGDYILAFAVCVPFYTRAWRSRKVVRLSDPVFLLAMMFSDANSGPRSASGGERFAFRSGSPVAQI